MLRRIKEAIKKREARQTVIILLSLLAIGAAVICWQSRALYYNGHTADHWLDEVVSPYGDNHAALLAFQGMGDEGAIFLANEAFKQPSAWQTWLETHSKKLPKRLQGTTRRWWFKKRQSKALDMLQHLEAGGKAGSPQVMEALATALHQTIKGIHTSQPSVPLSQIITLHRVLCHIGSDDRKSIDLLCDCANKMQLMPLWPAVHGKFNTAVNQSISNLKEKLNDTNVFNKATALILLGSASPENIHARKLLQHEVEQNHSGFKMVLIHILKDDKELRALAEQLAIDQLKTNEKPVVYITYPPFEKPIRLEHWLTEAAGEDTNVVEELFQAVEDCNLPEQVKLIQIIGRTRTSLPGTPERLSRWLTDENYGLRAAAASAIWEITRKNEDLLRLSVIELDSPDLTTARAAMKNIGDFGEKGAAAIPRVTRCLKHQDATMREFAAETLEKIRHQP